MRMSFVALLALAFITAPLVPGAHAQAPPPILQEPQTIPLWEGQTPGAQGSASEDIPTLTIYMPAVTTGPMTAVIVAPGGGYRALSMNKEGRQPANYLNSLGVAAFVLKYRLGPKYHHPIELGDMQRAIRIVRARAAEWHVNPSRIGVMGFSAGGHLASTASTQFDAGNAAAADPIDRVSSRPDFAILGYPVITLTEKWVASGIENDAARRQCGSRSRAQPLDRHPRTKETPPTFLFHTNADTSVPVENSVHYFLALEKGWGSRRNAHLQGRPARCGPRHAG